MYQHLQRVAVVAAMSGVALLIASSAFGAGVPVQPGNADATSFSPSSGCGCHASRVDEWSKSMHAKALVDTVFLTKVAEARTEAGDTVADFCQRCHSPIGNMIGDPGGVSSPAAKEGVTCMFCHQVTGLAGAPGNTNQLIEANQTRRAQIKDPAAPHPAVYSALHTKAEFCGGCHNVNHPSNGTHLEATYAEWVAGPYAKEGTVCQDCHMSSSAGVVGPASGTACAGGPQRDNIFTMTFVGANVAQGPAFESRALLKSAATLKLDVAEIVPEGATASMTVTITNTGAGHYLPTGLTEVREMWLTVYAEDGNGKKTEIGERRFGTVMKDAQGKHPVEMWNAVGIQSDDRIPPRESVAESYAFKMPAGAGKSTVVAALNYRSVPDELAAKAKVDNPTTVMASGTKVVYSSQEAKDAASKPSEPVDGGGGTGWLLIAGAVILALVALGAVVLTRRRRVS